jgi:phosphatidate phosphatase APP1
MAVVWQISAIQFRDKTLVNGIILKDMAWPDHLKTTKLKNIYLVLSSYFRKRYKNEKIIISTGKKFVEAKTDKYGRFSTIINQKKIEKIEVLPDNGSETFEIIQDYPVFFADNDNPVAAISDIDDTVLISNTQRMIKSVATVLFVTPDKRIPIDHTVELLKILHNKGSSIFYVSKSESNLFAMLSHFVTKNGLPVGYLHLTPYISFPQLFRTKGGKFYKEKALRFILDNSPDKRYVLFGDDTHHDIKIYSIIATAYPGRIIKVYIRKIKRYLSKSQRHYIEQMIEADVPVVYFSDRDNLDREVEFIKGL